jgi:hypothetical protein
VRPSPLGSLPARISLQSRRLAQHDAARESAPEARDQILLDLEAGLPQRPSELRPERIRVRGRLPSRRLAEQVEAPAEGEAATNGVQRRAWLMQRGDVDSEDLVVDLVVELGALDVAAMNRAFSAWARFRLVAISIIFGERSTAVIRPSSSRSQTRETATPCPHPTSRMRSSGPTSRTSTAHRSRSDAGPRIYNPSCLPRISFMSSEGGTAHRATDGLNI